MPGSFVEYWHRFLAGVLVHWAVSRPGDRGAALVALGNALLVGAGTAVRGDVAAAIGAPAA